MKGKEILATLLGVVLGLWCIGTVYDSFNVTNWYELMMGYIFLIAPFAVGLFFLSRKGYKDTKGIKILNITGMITSIASLIIPLVWILYVLQVHY